MNEIKRYEELIDSEMCSNVRKNIQDKNILN
jgi:hypothetical protein